LPHEYTYVKLNNVAVVHTKNEMLTPSAVLSGRGSAVIYHTAYCTSASIKATDMEQGQTDTDSRGLS